MANKLPNFNVVFFQQFIFLRSVFQQLPSFNSRYCQRACISTTSFGCIHERGNLLCNNTLFVCPARAITLLCLRPLPFLLYPSSTSYTNTNKNIILFTFTLKQLYNYTVQYMHTVEPSVIEIYVAVFLEVLLSKGV
jgi:hypothetical protein